MRTSLAGRWAWREWKAKPAASRHRNTTPVLEGPKVAIWLNIPLQRPVFRVFSGSAAFCLNKTGSRGIYEVERRPGGTVRCWLSHYAGEPSTFMSDRPRSLALPFPGHLGQREGDSSHFTELEAEVVGLFDQMRDGMLRYALSFGLPIADAEEILQEAFLALYQHLLRGGSRESLPGWLFRVTHNMALKRRTAIARGAASPLAGEGGRESIPIADPRPGPEEQFAFRQRQDRLRCVVVALPEIDRECLYLRAEGLRYREIAEVLGISAGSVANSLAKSLARVSAANERLG